MQPRTKAKAVARQKKEWHLVCVTRKGKVSMLQNLTLDMARETYRRLMPSTQPIKEVYPKNCRHTGAERSQAWCNYHNSLGGGLASYGYSGNRYHEERDSLEKVEALGPNSEALDPWNSVGPRIVKLPCYACFADEAEAKAKAALDANKADIRMKHGEWKVVTVQKEAHPPKPRKPRWDKRRTDFWNHPRLWDKIKDTHSQFCWSQSL